MRRARTLVLACAFSACGSDPASSPDATVPADAAVVLDAAPTSMDAALLPDFPPAMEVALLPDAPPVMDVAPVPDAPPAMDLRLLPDFSPVSDLPPVQCTGTFAGISQAQLAAAIAPSGQCAPATDVALICTGNVATIAGMCGVGCASQPAAMFKSCATTCIRSMVSLTAGCAGCYADTVACTYQNCLSQCLGNPSSPACLQCQIDKGCRAAFFTCTGLPGGGGRDAGTD